jgi:HlyD family secretion protein
MKVLVDEIDVRQVAVGQPVRLSGRCCARHADHRRDQDFAHCGQCQRRVAYEVTIVPDMTDAPLRAGMSATAIITTADVDDACCSPTASSQLDRDTGKAYVYKMVGGEPVLQEVELGLRNERESQIWPGCSRGTSWPW